MTSVPRADRLSALDNAFLALDTTRAPLHVGWTMRFEGRAPALAALRRHLDVRLHMVPRFRRVVRTAPLGLGDPHWVDDPAFDIANHVHAVRLRAPGGPGELRELASTLLSDQLDRARPLWRLYLVDGLAGGGFAVIGQAHHALVDGIAAIEVAMLLFSPDAPAGPAPRWAPERAPHPAGVARDALADRARASTRALRAAAQAARHTTTDALRDAAGAVENLARPAPATALDRNETGERVVAFAQAPLDEAREAGRRHGATVNDVLLSACAIALDQALRRRGDVPASLKVMVPVNTRGDEAAANLGNRISFMTVDLPMGEHDPVRVLRSVRDETRAQKAAKAQGPLDAVARAADVLPAGGAGAIARGGLRLASFNAIVSNVAGPEVPLELLGRRLVAIHPAVPVPDGHSISIGALSYCGRIHVGLYADAAVVGDVVDVARDIESAFDTLRLQATHAPTPWQERARARRRRLHVVR